MKIKKFFCGLLGVGCGFRSVSSLVMAAEVSLKDYNAVIVQDLEVPSGSPAPESAGCRWLRRRFTRSRGITTNISSLILSLKKAEKQAKKPLPGKKSSS